jgi:hypothetical protein
MNPKLLNLPTECEYSPISVTLFQSQENSWKIEFSENHLWLWASTVWLTCTAQECGYAHPGMIYQMQLRDPAMLHFAHLLQQQTGQKRLQDKSYRVALAEVVGIYVIRSCPSGGAHPPNR